MITWSEMKQNLQNRVRREQIELLWVMGSTWHNIAAIAEKMKIPHEDVIQIVSELERR